MRLSCPNCGAQYEVPDDVIPVAGRDVQCSNCGDTWFQKHKDAPDGEDALDDDSAAIGAGDIDPGAEENTDGRISDGPAQDRSWDDSADETTDTVVGELGDEPSDRVEHTDEADQIFEQSSEEEYPQEDAPVAPHDAQNQPLRQSLDPAISNVLREEAALESAARANDGAGGLESQPDLGLGEPENDGQGGVALRAQEARVRMARMRGEPDPLPGVGGDRPSVKAGSGAAMVGSRRDLLPDIEEINSTLRSTKDRRSAGDTQDPASPASLPQQRRRRGFRRGFSIMLLITAALILVYVYAPLISAKLPQLSSMMSLYVEQVNVVRLWLDGQMSAVMAWLDMKAVSGS